MGAYNPPKLIMKILSSNVNTRSMERFSLAKPSPRLDLMILKIVESQTAVVEGVLLNVGQSLTPASTRLRLLLYSFQEKIMFAFKTVPYQI